MQKEPKCTAQIVAILLCFCAALVLATAAAQRAAETTQPQTWAPETLSEAAAGVSPGCFHTPSP